MSVVNSSTKIFKRFKYSLRGYEEKFDFFVSNTYASQCSLVLVENTVRWGLCRPRALW